MFASALTASVSCDGAVCEFECATVLPDDATWFWEFGDGETSHLANPSHVYAEPGSYRATVTVSYGRGRKATAQTVTPGERLRLPEELTADVATYGAGRYVTRWDQRDPGLGFALGEEWSVAASSAELLSERWLSGPEGQAVVVAMTPAGLPDDGTLLQIVRLDDGDDVGRGERDPAGDLARALLADPHVVLEETANTTVGGYPAVRLDVHDAAAGVVARLVCGGLKEGAPGVSTDELRRLGLWGSESAGPDGRRVWVVDVDGSDVLIVADYLDECARPFLDQVDGLVDTIEFLPCVWEPIVTRMLRSGTLEVPVRNGTPYLHALATWALDRFVAAGLALPDVDSITFYSQQACEGHPGDEAALAQGRGVHLCFGESTEPEVAIRRALLHELGHIWTADHLDDATRREFLAARGLERWNDPGDEWKERGTEHASEILAWGLSGEPLAIARFADETCDSLAAGFSILTGTEPVTSPDALECPAPGVPADS